MAARKSSKRVPKKAPADVPDTAAADARDPASAGEADYAALAGMSDAKVREKTGRDWAGWVHVLDEVDADALEHSAIARIVSEQHAVADWWAQTVTVGYERIKGLRERGQRRGGSYEVSRSRTFAVAVDRLFDAWADEAPRRRWLGEAGATVRTATRPRGMRLRWPDGSIVALYFAAKGAARSAVTVQHTKLADRESADRLKAWWAERLDALGALLDEDGTA
jgi:hypothetical protein